MEPGNTELGPLLLNYTYGLPNPTPASSGQIPNLMLHGIHHSLICRSLQHAENKKEHGAGHVEKLDT